MNAKSTTLPGSATAAWRPFETCAPGKWVLAGEHAVLRGHEAVALPHPEMRLELRFEPTAAGEEAPGLRIQPADAEPVLRRILESIPNLELPAWRLILQSSIPLGAGLGSSAALCVCVTRWLSEPLGLRKEQRLEFATQLENLFHGTSSGMDVAVIEAGAPLVFRRGELPHLLSIPKLPRWTFHDTGARASTHQCIEQVEAFARAHPRQAERLDAQMGKAAQGAAQGLLLYGEGQTSRGISQLALAMELAHECFEAWGLLPPKALELRQALLAQGARAVKLTGAGLGGMVVALWE